MKPNKKSDKADYKRITNIQDLKNAGLIEENQQFSLEKTAENFAIGLSPHLVKLIHENPDNMALSRQYIPDAAELQTTPEEYKDPIGDAKNSPVKGIVHRYPDRVLLKAVNICAVYCRFCFRRELIGPGTETLSEFELEQAFKYIKDDESIWEVILTGGDPLILSPARLEKILKKLNDIDHVRVVRIHTRIPIADPDRLTAPLLSALQSCKKPLYIALHVNHADEITQNVEWTLKKLNDINCTLLSQSVLLNGINNNAETLSTLFKKLIELRIKPYELHHPDMTRGTSHFRLSLKEGTRLYQKLRGHISGLCLPHYMLDLPGGHGKIAITPNTVEQLEQGTYKLEDFKGNTHIYKDSPSENLKTQEQQ